MLKRIGIETARALYAALVAIVLTGGGIVVASSVSSVTPNAAVTTGTLAQFAATTSAQLFGVISNETGGSGVLVGSASPAFTGTVTGDRLTLTSTSGDALTATAAATNGDGVESTGAGTGAGVKGFGGTNSDSDVTGTSRPGGYFTGGSTNGFGVYGKGTGFGAGGRFDGGGSAGAGIVAQGFTSGQGITATGGSTSGTGGVFTGGSSNGKGAEGIGVGTGIGVTAQNTASGYALSVVTDTTSPVKAPIHVDPQDAQPTGAHVIGDMYVTSAGILKICTTAGTPGTWTSVGAQ